MKKMILTGVFVFSLLLNFTVAGILGWHYLFERRGPKFPMADCPMLSENDYKQISKVWSKQARSGVRETRQLINAKQSELIDQIARTPGDLAPAENTIRELMALREKMEREALSRLSNALVQLPDDRKPALISYVKNRSCMGPGMRFGGRMGIGRMSHEGAQEETPSQR